LRNGVTYLGRRPPEFQPNPASDWLYASATTLRCIAIKISIITVCFNSAATIEDTLRSVAEQTHPDVEHIIIDGGSSDRTMGVVDRYRAGLSQVVSEPDAGIYDAMNKGLALATGEIIGFLNADDHYAHPKVIAQVALAMEQEKLGALFGDVAFYRPDEPQRVLRRYRSDRFRPGRIPWGWMPAHPALFLRRDVFEKVGPFKTDYRIAGDFELVARVFHEGGIRYRHLPEVLVRMRTGGISTGGWRNTILLNREVLRACRENGISTNLLKVLSKYPAKLLELVIK
jgi:glycosyltransferase involved in cell wall biosynthesis